MCIRDRGHALSEREKSKLISNMMTVLAGESRPLPTLSLSDVAFDPHSRE